MLLKANEQNCTIDATVMLCICFVNRTNFVNRTDYRVYEKAHREKRVHTITVPNPVTLTTWLLADSYDQCTVVSCTG